MLLFSCPSSLSSIVTVLSFKNLNAIYTLFAEKSSIDYHFKDQMLQSSGYAPLQVDFSYFITPISSQTLSTYTIQINCLRHNE